MIFRLVLMLFSSFIEQIHEYQLPKDASDLIVEIEKALKTFDWDKMEELLNEN